MKKKLKLTNMIDNIPLTNIPIDVVILLEFNVYNFHFIENCVS